MNILSSGKRQIKKMWRGANMYVRPRACFDSSLKKCSTQIALADNFPTAVCFRPAQFFESLSAVSTRA